MALYFYELKHDDGRIIADERPEDHSTDEHALAYGKRVASELGRNDGKPTAVIVIKNEAQAVLAEIPVVYNGSLSIAS
jgi:hypothetical protein